MRNGAVAADNDVRAGSADGDDSALINVIVLLIFVGCLIVIIVLVFPHVLIFFSSCYY